MNEQEYQDKLKVREQLSQFDRLRVLEYEFRQLVDNLEQQSKLLDRLMILENKVNELIDELLTKGIIGETVKNFNETN